MPKPIENSLPNDEYDDAVTSVPSVSLIHLHGKPLPVELLCRIGQNLLVRDSQRWLANLRATSKSIYNIMTPVLYHHLYIQPPSIHHALPIIDNTSSGRDRRLITQACEMWIAGETERSDFSAKNSIIFKCLNLLHVRGLFIQTTLPRAYSKCLDDVSKIWNAKIAQGTRRSVTSDTTEVRLLSNCSTLCWQRGWDKRSTSTLDLRATLSDRPVDCCLDTSPSGHYYYKSVYPNRWRDLIMNLRNAVEPDTVRSLTFHAFDPLDNVPGMAFPELKEVRFAFSSYSRPSCNHGSAVK